MGNNKSIPEMDYDDMVNSSSRNTYLKQVDIKTESEEIPVEKPVKDRARLDYNIGIYYSPVFLCWLTGDSVEYISNTYTDEKIKEIIMRTKYKY